MPIIPEFLYDIKHPNATLSQRFEQAGPRPVITLPAIQPTSAIDGAVATSSQTTTTPKCPCASTKLNDSQLEFLYSATQSTGASTDLPGKLLLPGKMVRCFRFQCFFPDLSSTEGGRGGETGSSLEIEEREQQHRELLQETVAVGIMFASKAFVQLLANPIVGPLTHKYANRSPITDRRSATLRSSITRFLFLPESATAYPCSPASSSCSFLR